MTFQQHSRSLRGFQGSSRESHEVSGLFQVVLGVSRVFQGCSRDSPMVFQEVSKGFRGVPEDFIECWLVYRGVPGEFLGFSGTFQKMSAVFSEVLLGRSRMPYGVLRCAPWGIGD